MIASSVMCDGGHCSPGFRQRAPLTAIDLQERCYHPGRAGIGSGTVIEHLCTMPINQRSDLALDILIVTDTSLPV
jgi:hypothetical protein